MSRPGAVVFDFDGLILDTEWTGYLSTAAVFAAHGEELSLELWRSFVGTTDHPHWADILEAQLGRPVDRAHWMPRRVADGLARARRLDLRQGVGSLVAALAEAGVPMGVASSSRSEWVWTHLDERGLSPAFSTVCTGEEVERTKPDPALYLLACERLGVAPGDAVALEDSVLGVRAAKSAGMAAVAVPSTLTAPMDFSEADLVVASCAELDPAGLGRAVARNING